MFMVRDAVSSVVFPYALFPSLSPEGCDLFLLLWEAIERFTKNGFRALAVTGDGASCNRVMFRMHSKTKEIVYKTRNVFSADNHFIYFILDPPHLIKTK